MALVEFVNDSAPYLSAENLNNNFNYLDDKISNIEGSKQLLWTNPNPTSNFTSTQIDLASNTCDCFEVIYATLLSETNETATTGRIPFGKRVRMSNAQAYGVNIRVVQRVITTSSNTRLTLEQHGYAGIHGSVGTNDSACIPLYVIGYKTGLFS